MFCHSRLWKLLIFSTYPPYIREANVSDWIDSLPSSRPIIKHFTSYINMENCVFAIFGLISAAQVKHVISFQLLPHFCILQIMLGMLVYIGTSFVFLAKNYQRLWCDMSFPLKFKIYKFNTENFSYVMLQMCFNYDQNAHIG